MKEVKELSQKKRSKNLYLSVLSRIKQGRNPSQIAEELGVSKQRLNHYIATLKKSGSIVKISYGVWEYVKPFTKRSKSKTIVIGKNGGGSLKQDNVRGHGFLFKLDLPKDFRNWNKREEILTKLKVKYDPYYVGGVKRGQRITSDKTKVALTNKSIIVNFPESYIAETSTLAKKDAVATFLRVIKRLERLLRADFSIFGKYKFRVSRQHYALMKNSLARQYLDEKKKLNVYSGRGLWLLIDNSYNLEELETVHPKTADKDNIIVQDFFNGLKMAEGFTPQFVLKALAENNTQLLSYAEQNKEHLALIQEYRAESRDNRKESIANRKVMLAILNKLGGTK